MTQNEGQNFGSSSRALGAFDQRGPYGILIHLGVDFVKMNESQFRAENPAAKYPLPYRQQLLSAFLSSPFQISEILSAKKVSLVDELCPPTNSINLQYL